MELFKKARYALYAAPALALSAPAFAEDSELATAVQGVVATAKADVGAIGLAIIGVVVAVVAFSWVRRVIR